VQVALASIEVMLVLSAVEPSVVLLYYACLFVEELRLFVFIFFLFLVHELATSTVAPPDALDGVAGTAFVLASPLVLQVKPVPLDGQGCRCFSLALLLSLVDHLVVSVDHVAVPLVPFFEQLCHFE